MALLASGPLGGYVGSSGRPGWPFCRPPGLLQGQKHAFQSVLPGFSKNRTLKSTFTEKIKLDFFFHATSPPINVLNFLCLTNFLARFPLEWAKPRKIDIFGGFLVFSTPISTFFFFFC